MALKQNKLTADFKYQNLCAFSVFAAVFIFLIWFVQYSYYNEDESLYYTFPLRLVLGDSLLTDEWLHVQLSGFLLYLPAKAFLYINGSTEGIALFFRYFYVVFQCTVSVVVYCRLRKHGVFAIFAALMNYLHIPFSFVAMSYNTIGFNLVLLIGVLMATATKQSRPLFYIVGLLFACAVVCNPLLAFVYILYTIFVIIDKVVSKKGRKLFQFSEISFSLKTWGMITLGISTVAAIFLIFLLSRASIGEILDNLPMLFSNPWLKSTSRRVPFFYAVQYIYKHYYPYQISVFGILILAAVLDKKRLTRRPLYLIIAAIAYAAFMIQILLSPVLPDYEFFFIMFPLSLFGLTCYFLLETKEKQLFVFLWLLGFLYALCLTLSSASGLYSAMFGLGVSDVAGVIFIRNIIMELKKPNAGQAPFSYKRNKAKRHMIKINPKAIAAVLLSVLFVQVGSEIYIKAHISRYGIECAYAAYHSNEKATLDTAMDSGPLKGIKTTSGTAKLYSAMMNDLSLIKKTNVRNQPVLMALSFPMGYLYLEMPFSAYTEEYYDFDDGSRLMKYYELHPDKAPGYMYIPKIRDLGYDSYLEKPEDVLADVKDNYNCTVKESETGYIITIINRY